MIWVDKYRRGELNASEFTTRIVEDAALVRIVNSGCCTPNAWVAPFIGPALIEAETRKQFGEFRGEILRRSERLNGAPQ